MQVELNPIKTIEVALQEVASQTAGFDVNFSPGVRIADPKFGDYQANGVLGYAKITQENPRKLAQSLIDSANNSEQFDSDMVNLSLAGPGFINFKLTGKFFIVTLSELLPTVLALEASPELFIIKPSALEILLNETNIIVDFNMLHPRKRLTIFAYCCLKRKEDKVKVILKYNRLNPNVICNRYIRGTILQIISRRKPWKYKNIMRLLLADYRVMRISPPVYDLSLIHI